jgi:hypothetical protein
MSSKEVNAERRLRRRVMACTYRPVPQEIADIETLLLMLDLSRARRDGMTRMVHAIRFDRFL